MATARSVAARARPMTLLGGNPDMGPVVTGAPSEAVGTVRSTFDDVTAGRVSLGMLMVLILGVLAFYAWTNSVQGGG